MMSSGRLFKFRVLAMLALVLSSVVAAFATIGDAPETSLLLPRGTLVEELPIEAAEAIMQVPDRFLREERFQRGDTLPALLARLGVSDEEGRRIAKLGTLRAIRPGTTVSAEVNGAGELQRLNFIPGRDNLVTVTRDAAGWRAVSEPAPLEERIVMKAGMIKSSLFAAADGVGLPDGVSIQLAEIFGSDIDFHRDLRRGDRFSVVYEMNYLDGRAIRSGRVLSAEFVNQAKTFRAVWFAVEDADGRKVGGYYAPDGSNLRKAFLRSPLEFSRISSGFGLRLHPFLQTWREHKGVDYAAPSGTRVRAVGDAVVDFAGKQGGYGNVVILRHQGQYTTVYAHLSSFGPGVQKGARISQGDTLGFVGQTGWATGPHLHYEFRMGGEARNPLTIAMPAALPIPPLAMQSYRRHADPLVTRLELLRQQSNLALLE
jgi:murein DD-endopeptidase MepM/ murein hydrolase activator NlpD